MYIYYILLPSISLNLYYVSNITGRPKLHQQPSVDDAAMWEAKNVPRQISSVKVSELADCDLSDLPFMWVRFPPILVRDRGYLGRQADLAQLEEQLVCTQ